MLDLPAATSSPSVQRSPLGRLRHIARSGALLLATAATIALVQPAPDVSRAATTEPTPSVPSSSIPAIGDRWFALGANVPFLEYRCDFGCGLQRGVRGNEAQVDAMLRDMSRSGVRVVRWYLFPGDAWQIKRRANGVPFAVDEAALLDLDVAVRLAARHDVYLLPVLLPEPDAVPRTWFTVPFQARQLANVLRPMFGRYRSDSHLLGWELTTGAEQLLDDGVATRGQLRAHARALRLAARGAAPRALAAIGTLDIARIDVWTGLGASFYTPQFVTGHGGARCATCRSVRSLAASEGADAPVVIGGFDAPTSAVAQGRLKRFAQLGYAGGLAWSWRGISHPQRLNESAPMPADALWRFHYERAGTGPRSRPLNPCIGPHARDYRCPNLRMARPSNLSPGRMNGRPVLFSRNSLDSHGAGPASLRGQRLPGDSRYSMSARQLLHRVSRRPVAIDTGAQLQFKAIPGQYRYWKWNGAARMELWRLDSTGAPVEIARTGPKTVYCLRDLQRTQGSLPRSPGGRVYPACSQRLGDRAVTLGTSVGWSDIYPASYYENWVDVSGLRGCFAYVHVADPLNVIYESNEDDNSSQVVVRLPWTGSNAGCPGAAPVPTIGDNGTY